MKVRASHALLFGAISLFIGSLIYGCGGGGGGGGSTVTKPAAPKTLVATAGNTQVGLTWAASTGATSYNLERSTTSGGPYSQVKSGISTTSTTDSGLTNGTTYFYVVTASNSAGTSPASNQASATPSASGTAPAPPATVTAVSGTSQIGLTWAASTGATSYNVKRGSSAAGPFTLVMSGVLVTNFTDKGLTNGTKYFYVITATNGNGTSGNSPVASATAGLTPNLEVEPVANEAAALAWLGNGSSYNVTLSSSAPNGSTGQTYPGEYHMAGSSGGFITNAKMRAAYTGINLYIQIEWDDPTATQDNDHRRFLFNGTNDGGATVAGWSSQLNDDKMSLAFNISGAADGTGSFDTKGCTVGCHGTMNPLSGTMDVWNWRKGTSNALGFALDEVADSAGLRNDAGTPVELRNWKTVGDPSAGPGNYYDPTSLQTVTLPNPAEGSVTLDPKTYLLKTHMTPLNGDATAGQTIFNNTCSGCHSPFSSWSTLFKNRGLTNTDSQLRTFISGGTHSGASSTTSFTDTDWSNVEAWFRSLVGVPGYVLQAPSGSCSDVNVMNSKTVYNAGHYTVQMRRALKTGRSDDVQFDTAVKTNYIFSIAVMDKDAKNHAGHAVQTMKFLP